MSLRSLAEKHLSLLSSSCLSQRDNPKGRPGGTNSTLAISAGTNGTTGTHGTAGTLGTNHWQTLQAEADMRNAKAKRERRTDRYCRCGRLSECAWPLDGQHDVWRCFACLPTNGSA